MPETEKDDSTSFWKTLPGVLTGVAALLTAVGGLVVALVQVFGTPSQVAVPPEAGGATPGPSVAATSAAETPAQTTAPSTSTEPGVLHQDRLEMKDADFADLETGMIGNPPPNDDLYLHGNDLLAPHGSTPVSGPYTKAACAAALTDRTYQTVHLAEVGDDQWLCVQTKEGHLGGMKIVQDAGPGRPIVIFEYVLWR